MPDIRTRIGRYCRICQYIHDEEYLVCDYCNEHKTWIYLKDIYYNYGFCKRSYHTCGECYSNLFGPLKLVLIDDMIRAYESVLEVVKDKTDGRKEEDANKIVID